VISSVSGEGKRESIKRSSTLCRHLKERTGEEEGFRSAGDDLYLIRERNDDSKEKASHEHFLAHTRGSEKETTVHAQQGKRRNGKGLAGEKKVKRKSTGVLGIENRTRRVTNNV